MIKIKCVGIVSDDCNDCKKLKESLRIDFKKCGIELVFNEVLFEDDEDYAVDLAIELGIKTIPSFCIDGTCFGEVYSFSKIDSVSKNILTSC